MARKFYTEGETCSECDNPVEALGYCHTHYMRDHSLKNTSRSTRVSLSAPIERKISNIVVGSLPGDNEKAIYYLRRADQVPFYAGSTVSPCKRLVRHRKDFGYDDVEMVVLRLCSIGEEVYWESKLIVDLTEIGYNLENTVASRPSKIVNTLDTQKVIDLYLTGLSKEKVGEYFGVSKGPIIRILEEHSIPNHGVNPGRFK